MGHDHSPMSAACPLRPASDRRRLKYDPPICAHLRLYAPQHNVGREQANMLRALMSVAGRGSGI